MYRGCNNINKKKIFINLDEAIFDLPHTLSNLYNEDFEYYENFKFVHYKNIKTLDYKELELAPPELIIKYMNTPRFFEQIELIESAKWIITRLYGTGCFDFIFLSQGEHPNIIQKKAWILNNFAFADFIYTNLSNTNMENSYYISNDIVKLDVSNAKEKICFGREYDWNKQWDGIRTETWIDFYEYIKQKEDL